MEILSLMQYLTGTVEEWITSVLQISASIVLLRIKCRVWDLKEQFIRKQNCTNTSEGVKQIKVQSIEKIMMFAVNIT